LDSSNKVQLRYKTNSEEHCVIITSANFDSELPSFRDSSDQLYNVFGEPETLLSFPANTIDSTLFASHKKILDTANKATKALCEHWCELSLLHLLSVLNTHAVSGYTLTVARGTKHQSGYKYVMFLEGTYNRDNSSVNDLIRPDCEDAAKLYRSYLKQHVELAGFSCDHGFNTALEHLERSSGLFNVGPENVIDKLRASDASCCPPVEISEAFPDIAAGFVFMLGMRCIMLIGQGIMMPDPERRPRKRPHEEQAFVRERRDGKYGQARP
jgi:hypothetical protein